MFQQDVLDEIISGLDPHDRSVSLKIRRAIRRAIVEEVNDVYDAVNVLLSGITELEERFGPDLDF